MKKGLRQNHPIGGSNGTLILVLLPTPDEEGIETTPSLQPIVLYSTPFLLPTPDEEGIETGT